MYILLKTNNINIEYYIKITIQKKSSVIMGRRFFIDRLAVRRKKSIFTKR